MKRVLLWSVWAVVGFAGCITENAINEGGAGGAVGIPGDGGVLGDAGSDPDQGGTDASTDGGTDGCADVVCAFGEACEDGQCVRFAGGPEISVSRPVLDFGRVPANEESRLSVTVTNIGSLPLEIPEVVVNGSLDFLVRVGPVELRRQNIPADPDDDGTPGLSPGASFELTITYAPRVEGPDRAEVIIFSNDPNQADVVVSLAGNGNNPCIRVNPEALAFGGALPNRETTRPLRIESCGGQPLEIFSITLSDDTAPAFALTPALPEFPLVLPAVQRDAPPPSQDIAIGFTPPAIEAYAGTAIISSNDPVRPVIEIPLTGRGSDNQCPVAVVADAVINIRPHTIVELDGSLSTDPDGPNGQPLHYEWLITQRPDGSSGSPAERFEDRRRPADTGIPDDTSTPNVLFFADFAGSYTLELRVIDNQGLMAPSDACPQPAAIVQIESRYDADVYVEMVWNTPGDPDQTDGDGTDVDLHVRHPNGRDWSSAPFDCYYANIDPDWGPVGDAGDPRMELEDINGAGPEIISVNAPEDTTAFDGTYYRVGVHYYRADNFVTGGTWGPSEVTTRIYLEGALAGEWVQMMADSGNFWEVADVVWTPDEKGVIEVNRQFDELP